jgi:hypothetical protein
MREFVVVLLLSFSLEISYSVPIVDGEPPLLLLISFDGFRWVTKLTFVLQVNKTLEKFFILDKSRTT